VQRLRILAAPAIPCLPLPGRAAAAGWRPARPWVQTWRRPWTAVL